MRNLGALSRFALLGLVGGLAGACSETARFSGNPFSNPFGSGEPAMTGSTAPSAAVETQPLAPPAAGPLYNRPAAPVATAPRAPAPVPTQVTAGPAGWTAKGGTPVTVRQGDSLAAIATRYGVPPAAILSANGLKAAAQVAPGRTIVIPVYNAAGVAQPAPAPAKPAPVAQARQGEPKLRFVQGPKGQETSPKPGTATERVRKAGAVPEPQKPAPQMAKAQPKPEPAKPAVQAQKAPPAAPQAQAPKAPEAPKAAQTEVPKTTGSLAEPAPAPQAPAPGFRWPAKGRVISGFGGAGGNEGINIAVPEGTPVKAAEDGTVAYAGSDVKGYGKLVLIRHEGGYVSAYAHNGEISVKPGEKVKRGQPIAKSGQTGNVTSPQLHFELRKGPQPIDPMPHLQGG
jgi:murein DD-endopeptidase MepM/ murein hydrolase activator NlpD